MMQRNVLRAGSFSFEAGGSIDDARIVYHTSPRNYVPGEKVVWICHALTANSDPEDWWPQLVGEGKLLDPSRMFIVCVTMICSPYGECGPAYTCAADGRPARFAFPKTTIRDMAAAMNLVRKALGIEKVDLLIGSSIGGFQALEFAIMEPEVFANALFMATAARVSPWLSAQAETQRMALEADATFRSEEGLEGGKEGLKCARAQALISYRCHEGYGLRQSEPDDDTLFASRSASYQRHQGDKLVARGFDAYSYWYLCHALDSHNVGRGRGGVAAALARIQARTVVAVVDTDGIFPPAEMKQMAEMIPGARYEIIHSSFGHDGFLLENDRITEILLSLMS